MERLRRERKRVRASKIHGSCVASRRARRAAAASRSLWAMIQMKLPKRKTTFHRLVSPFDLAPLRIGCYYCYCYCYCFCCFSLSLFLFLPILYNILMQHRCLACIIWRARTRASSFRLSSFLIFLLLFLLSLPPSFLSLSLSCSLILPPLSLLHLPSFIIHIYIYILSSLIVRCSSRRRVHFPFPIKIIHLFFPSFPPPPPPSPSPSCPFRKCPYISRRLNHPV